ncbi:MAG: DegV family protein [Actinomycetota bacterium]
MIGLVVDSNSQLPVDLADRYGIVVVPLAIRVDGIEYREGIDLDADAFYDSWADGHTPEISTSTPSPGVIAAAYAELAAAGADELLSIHVTESMSGTINAARLAAESVDVPVRVLDSGTASFGIACCAWAAADAIEAGADLDRAAAVAVARADSLRTSFVVGVPRLTERSGRADGLDLVDAADDGVPVLAMSGGDLVVLTTANDLDAAVDAMVADALSWPPSGDDGLRVAIGTSDESSRPVSIALTQRLDGHAQVAEVVQYRIGPSIGAHTGPGTAGLFCF